MAVGSRRATYFAGTLDEVAVFLLTAVRGAGEDAEYKASPAAANLPPTASFTQKCSAAGSCAFDGSASADSDGTVAGYAWKLR